LKKDATRKHLLLRDVIFTLFGQIHSKNARFRRSATGQRASVNPHHHGLGSGRVGRHENVQTQTVLQNTKKEEKKKEKEKLIFTSANVTLAGN
jgi:hypothetical protein